MSFAVVRPPDLLRRVNFANLVPESYEEIRESPYSTNLSAVESVTHSPLNL